MLLKILIQPVEIYQKHIRKRNLSINVNSFLHHFNMYNLLLHVFSAIIEDVIFEYIYMISISSLLGI